MIALENATVVTLAPPRVQTGTVLIEGDRIDSIGQATPAGALVVDCGGRLVLPGQVCAHTHLYSTLARGMPPPALAPATFGEILERVWWKLDRALDAEAISVSARIGALEAAKAGTSTLFDHHSSPACIDGALDLVGEAIDQVGLRGVLCYEVSDRNGPDGARAGLAENDRFLTALREKKPSRLRGLVGAHAAFTLSDATADRLAEVCARHLAPLHIHLAEDAIDARKDGVSTVKWLHRRQLLSQALLAHGVHFADEDAELLFDCGAEVVHNPRSNANNQVGYARPSRFHPLLLGTDGIGADMLAEAQAAFFASRHQRDPIDVRQALVANQVRAARAFGLPLGAVERGAVADVAVFESLPPTPVTPESLVGHLLFGLPGRGVRHLVVGGRLVLRDGKSLLVDEEALCARARAVAARLWQRMADLPDQGA